jgi:transformation/transcription domain-associated protein
MAFGEVCEKMISDNVFSQYMYKTLPTCNHLWVFKKQFCTQVGAMAALPASTPPRHPGSKPSHPIPPLIPRPPALLPPNHPPPHHPPLCLQMALSALLSRMLLIGGRSPNKVLLAKDTGRVFQQDFYIPVYGERGWPEQQEAVPFRWGGEGRVCAGLEPPRR